eukprot:jgi/Mesvir1/10316/Mv06178-RA.1
MKIGGMELSEEEVAEFREVFDLVDRDRGGTISPEEVQELMCLLGMNPSQDDVIAIIQEIDEDGNGEVDFEEFLLVMAGQQNTKYNKADIKKAFKLFADYPSESKISVERLKNSILHYCHEKIAEDDLVALIEQLGVPDKGLINYSEKVDTFLS